MQEGIIDPGFDNFRQAAHILAKFGREGDTYVVHAAEGETVIPVEVLDANPKMKKMLFQQMEEMGLEPERYVVGNELNSLNPVTGQPEFFFKSITKSIGKVFKKVKDVVKKVAPVILPIAAPFIFPAMPAFMAAGLGSFGGSLLGGADVKSALKSGIMAGVTAGAINKIGGGSFFGKAGQKGTLGDAFESVKSGEAFQPTNPFSGLSGGSSQVTDQMLKGPPPEMDVTSQILDESIAVPDSNVLTSEELLAQNLADKGAPASQNAFKPKLVRTGLEGQPTNYLAGQPTITPDTDLNFFEKYLFNPGENVAGLDAQGNYITKGEATLEGLLSTNRTSLNPEYQALKQAAKQNALTTGVSDAARKAAVEKTLLEGAKAEAPGMFATYGPLGATAGGTYLAYDALTQEPPEDEPEGPTFEEQQNQLYEEAMAELDAEGDRYVGKETGPASGFTTSGSNLDKLLAQYYGSSNPLEDDEVSIFDRIYGRPVRAAEGGEIIGPGTPTSDSIPAMLSDGEFVMNARAVRGAGNGDRRAGAKRMYQMMRQLEGRA